MSNPTVSFVIPCYKLSHLLPDCIASILSQTYTDFDILVMDDCSPDNTQEVANSFHDPRVVYIRNDHNVGNLRNYNKGVRMSRGKYVWLISADDYLRRPYVLERYVRVMEQYPNVGYSLCPGVVVRHGQERETLGYSVYGKKDRIFEGRTLLKRLVKSNVVVAASALVRRQCYNNSSPFPLQVEWAGQKVVMRWVGDWYLWCLFALDYDVAYFAEPMVCYRDHQLSMTSTITGQSVQTRQECASADISVPWVIRQMMIERGMEGLSRGCLHAAANAYARHADTLGIEACEESLCRGTEVEGERNWVRARMSAAMGDISYWQGDLERAKKLYRIGLRRDPAMARVYVKLLLLAFGAHGDRARKLLRLAKGKSAIIGANS
jgi:glycosyltransferase involved in cell wall biosynthesis